MFKKIISLFLCIAMFYCINLCAYASEQAVFYVNCNAESTGDGSFEAPFLNLNEAKNAIRALKNNNAYPKNGVTVYIRGGNYLPFALTEEDSGIDDGEITYAAYENEEVVILGGTEIWFSDFSVSNDGRIADDLKSKIYSYSLKENNISDYGGLGVTGHSRYYLAIAGWGGSYSGMPLPTVLFDDSSMTLARYPNEGYMYIKSVLEAGYFEDKTKNPNAEMAGMKFTVDDERISKWAEASEPWVFGFWKWDWSDMTTPVESINLEKGSIKTTYASPYSPQAGRPFYIYNMLEELDVPGEWFYDKENGELYIYPVSKNGNEKITLGFSRTNLVSMSNVKYVNLNKIKLKATRGSGISASNCENISITNCEVSNVSGNGISIGGKNNLIDNCKVYGTGERGISVSGGSLTEKAGNTVSDCEIYDVGKFTKMMTPAIHLSGASHTVKGNIIYNCPQIGIYFGGNLHLIENNEIYDVMKESTDGGAIYSGQSYANWGNTIKGNTVHDVRNGKSGAYGVYLDDCVSGITVSENRFYNIGGAAMFNQGGRSNKFLNNTVENTTIGISYSGFAGSSEPRDVWDFVSEESINNAMLRELFGERFYNIPNDDPVEPKYGIVKGNICVNVDTPLRVSKGYRNITLKWIYENNELCEPLRGYYENDELKTEKMIQSVQKTSPYNGAKASVYHENISIGFLYPVSEESVNRDNIKVYENENSEIGYTVSLSDDAKEIKISLTEGLKENSSYKITVSKDVASSVGVNSIESDFVFCFTTLSEDTFYYEDFENAVVGTDCSSYGFSKTADEKFTAEVQTDIRNSKALKITDASEKSVTLSKKFSEIQLPDSGKIEISFDVLFENRTRTFLDFAKLTDSNNTRMISQSSWHNDFYRYNTWKEPVYTNNGIYYKFRYILDMDNNVYSKYLNDKLRGENISFSGDTASALAFTMQTAKNTLGCNNYYRCACPTDAETGEKVHNSETCTLHDNFVMWLDNFKITHSGYWVRITGENGETVSKVSEYEGEDINTTIFLPDDITDEKTAIVVLKNTDGKIKEISAISNNEFIEGEAKKTVSIPVSDSEDYKIEIYLWSDYLTMVPLAHKITKK